MHIRDMNKKMIKILLDNYNCLIISLKKLKQEISDLKNIKNEKPKHNELRELQGGSQNNYYHSTFDELQKLISLKNIKSFELIDKEVTITFDDNTNKKINLEDLLKNGDNKEDDVKITQLYNYLNLNESHTQKDFNSKVDNLLRELKDSVIKIFEDVPNDNKNYIRFNKSWKEMPLPLKGDKGDKGEPFSIYKTYSSVQQMNLDSKNIPQGSFLLITSNVEDEDNAKLYVKTESNLKFITDLSGANGIKGNDGITPYFSIGSVASGTQPQVYITGTAENPILNFVLERGEKGESGTSQPSPKIEHLQFQNDNWGQVGYNDGSSNGVSIHGLREVLQNFDEEKAFEREQKIDEKINEFQTNSLQGIIYDKIEEVRTNTIVPQIVEEILYFENHQLQYSVERILQPYIDQIMRLEADIMQLRQEMETLKN